MEGKLDLQEQGKIIELKKIAENYLNASNRNVTQLLLTRYYPTTVPAGHTNQKVKQAAEQLVL